MQESSNSASNHRKSNQKKLRIIIPVPGMSKAVARAGEVTLPPYMGQNVDLDDKIPIREGGFGYIYRGRYNGEKVCVKGLRGRRQLNHEKLIQSHAQKLVLWKQLSHENVLQFHGICDSCFRKCLVSPWMENGNITQFLLSQPQADRFPLVLDITKGLEYLHAHDIIHGSLKGANVLISDKERAVLNDFGLVPFIENYGPKRWDSPDLWSKRWTAPEIIIMMNTNRTKENDVYGLGCTFYEIFTGELPLSHLSDEMAVFAAKYNSERPHRPSEAHAAWTKWGLTPKLWELIESCWDNDPALRPKVSDVLQSLLDCRTNEGSASE